ncbi:MAG TPA: hypothetical protein VNM50_00130 [Chloroflexota bacterium]|jgi:hypothetical protein|nr:hypothetical protein [Chloroflexota bacterium]
MGATTHFYMVLGELPPRCRDLLRHLAAQPQPFALSDRVLPPGGVAAWAGAFQLLCASEALERVGWGQTPRFQIKPSARRALVWYAPSVGS